MSRFRTSKIEEKIAYEIFRSCRLCGAGAGYKMPIVQNVDLDGDVPLTQKIRECVQIEVHQEDKMPPLICELCVDKVNDFYEFSEMCKQTNMKTRLRLGLPPQTMPRGAPNAGDCILGLTETIFGDEDSNEPIIKQKDVKQSKSKKETSDKVKIKSSENSRNTKSSRLSPEINRRATRRSISSPTNILTLRNRNSKDQKVDQPKKKPSEPLKSILKKEKNKEEDILVTKSKRGRDRESISYLPVKRVKIEDTASTSKSKRKSKSPPRSRTKSPPRSKTRSPPRSKTRSPPRSKTRSPPSRTRSPETNLCKLCKRSFPNKSKLENHIKTHQNDIKNSKSKKSTQVVETMSKEKIQVRGKSDSKQNDGYICECGKEYYTSRNLRRHQIKCTPKKDIIIDPELMAKIRPLQIRISRCDPILDKKYCISEIPHVFGLDKNRTYPYFDIKTEPKTGKDGMVRIESPIKDVFDDSDFIHWDSDTSIETNYEPTPKRNKISTLSILSLKTIFSSRYLGRVRRRKRKVKTEIDKHTENKDSFDVIDSFDDVHDLERINDSSFDQLFGNEQKITVPNVEDINDTGNNEGNNNKEGSLEEGKNTEDMSKEENIDKEVSKEENSDIDVSKEYIDKDISKEENIDKELSKKENSNLDVSKEDIDKDISKEENSDNELSKEENSNLDVSKEYIDKDISKEENSDKELSKEENSNIGVSKQDIDKDISKEENIDNELSKEENSNIDVSKENSDKDISKEENRNEVVSKEENSDNEDSKEENRKNEVSEEDNSNKEVIKEDSSNKEISISKEDNDKDKLSKDVINSEGLQKEGNGNDKEDCNLNKETDKTVNTEENSNKDNNLNEEENINNQEKDKLKEDSLNEEVNSINKDIFSKEINSNEWKITKELIEKDIDESNIEHKKESNGLSADIKDNKDIEVGKQKDIGQYEDNLDVGNSIFNKYESTNSLEEKTQEDSIENKTNQKTDLKNENKPKDISNNNNSNETEDILLNPENKKSICHTNEVMKMDKNEQSKKSIIKEINNPENYGFNRDIKSNKEETDIKAKELKDFLRNEELISENDLLGDTNDTLSQDSIEFDERELDSDESIDKNIKPTNNENVNKEGITEDVKVKEYTSTEIVNGESNEDIVMDDQKLMDELNAQIGDDIMEKHLSLDDFSEDEDF